MKDKEIKIFFFIGTTAELIKLIPLIREMNKRSLRFMIISSGQNDVQFEEFADSIQNSDIVYAVTPKSKDSCLLLFFLWAVRAFISLLIGMRDTFHGLDKSNSIFIVHGDTISSVIGSFIAKIYGLKLVHVESGLRSFNFFEPFPEEISRYIISSLADVHCCPNEWAMKNLQNKGGKKLNTYQNTLIEIYLNAIKKRSIHPLVGTLKKNNKKYFVLVVHRQEHVVFGKKKMVELISKVLDIVPSNFYCVFLAHDLSNSFIKLLSQALPLEISKRIIRISRLPYVDFIHLLENSEFVVTDGGSNQEELYYMGKPCLLLRNVTERIEGLGENVVLSKNNIGIIEEFINNYQTFQRRKISLKKRPSEIIVNFLLNDIK